MSARETPASWIVAPIADLLEPQANGQLLDHGWSPQCHKEPARSEDEWGVLKTTSIQPGAFHDEHNKRLPDKLSPRPNLEVRAGDVLLTCAGPRARCGVPCLVRETRPRLILSGKMYRFRARQGLVEPRYLEAFLLSNPAQAAIDRMKTGISDSGLNLTHGRFKRLPVVLAPLSEQHRIVSAIESYFTRLDDAVATLERVQRNLKRYRASVLKAAVEGRLVPTEAELARAEGRSYEPAAVLLSHILVERRRRWEEAELAKMTAKGRAPKDDKWKAKYVEPVAPDINELPELPEGWSWATLDQVTDVIDGGTATTATSQATPRRVLRSSSVRQGSVDLSDHRFLPADPPAASDALLNSGELLLTRLSGTLAYVGNCAVVPPLHGVRLEFPDRLFRARVSELVRGAYVCSCFGVKHLRRRLEDAAKSTAGHQRISLSDLKRFCIPLPPLTEQVRIAEAIGDQLSVAQSAETAASANAKRCTRLRQSILKWAFEGRLVDQDPTDEPASVLLERIRAERASDTDKPPRRARAAKGAGP